MGEDPGETDDTDDERSGRDLGELDNVPDVGSLLALLPAALLYGALQSMWLLLLLLLLWRRVEGDAPRSPLPLRFRKMVPLFAVAVRAYGDVGGLEDDDDDEPMLLLYESDLACSPGRVGRAVERTAAGNAAKAAELELELEEGEEEEEELDAGTEDDSKLRLLRRAQMSKLVSILCERRRV